MATVGRTRGQSPPPIRLRGVPPLDPPFDDEVAPDAWAGAFGAAQLALDWSAGPPASTGGERPPAVQSGTPTAVAGASADAREAVRRFLGRCLEILNGYRPAGHIRPFADPAEAAGIVNQVTAASSRAARSHRADPAAGSTGGRRGADAVRVRRLRVCEPRAGAAEASVVLGCGELTWALAFRLEDRDGTWTATTLRVV